MSPLLRGAVAVLLGLGVNGCASSDADDNGSKRAFAADVVVTSDPGHGLGGVDLSLGGQKLATTDAQGRARVALQGTEGDAVEIGVTCPAGFQAPPEPITVSLRRFSSDSAAPSFAARCAPLARTIVVGIRAENGPNLPVVYLGKEIARTDAWGAAHVVLTVKAGEQVTLGLDTKSLADGRPKLRPESPTLTFVAKDKDDVLVLEQRFDIERPTTRTKSAPVRGGPTRI